MIRPEIQSLATPISKLKPHPQNVRQGDVGAISLSLEQHGQYRPIVVQQSTGFILAGNHTYKAAKALKWKDVAATFVDVDDEQALRILLIDNRANDLASYDDSALVEMLKALMDTELKLDGTGFDSSDLDQLLKDLEMETGNPIEGDPDAVPDDAPSKTVPGDVWLLGDHRLMCKDSMNTELPSCDAIISDPPYGMKVDVSWYGGEVGASLGGKRIVKSNHQQKGKLEWDQNDFDPRKYAEHCETVAMFGANYFCNLLPERGTWWVWDKRTTESGDVQNAYGMPFELIWIKGKYAHRIIRHLWAGFTRKAEKADKERLHPTQKPVAVMRELIEYLTKEGQIILDPFGGSGSTLIAAHQTGRTAYLMELDPHYCDVICKRFQQATGIIPIAEATGNEHSFIE